MIGIAPGISSWIILLKMLYGFIFTEEYFLDDEYILEY